MRVSVYRRHYVTRKGEKRYYLVVREPNKKEHHIRLGNVSRKVADERRVLVLNELLTGSYQRVSEVRYFFGEFCEKFLKFAEGVRASTTVEKYRHNLKLAKSAFKGLRLDQIRREDVERFLSERPIGNRTKNDILSTLRFVFQKAVDWRYLASSPAQKVKRLSEDKGGSRSLETNELVRLLESAGPWAKSVIKVMVYAGTRKGELGRLKFQDIDWDNKKLRIVSDRVRKTKNRKSRIVPLCAELEKELRFLADHWPNLNYASGQCNAGPYLPRTEQQREYVFCHRDGSPMKNLGQAVTRTIKKAGLEGVTPHGLRKTFCSLLAKGNVHPKVAQRLMGHSDMRLTMDVYTEVDTDQIREAVNTLPTLRDLQKTKFRVVGNNS